MQKQSLRWLSAGALALVSSAAFANFHTFVVDEVYSDATGTVQYVVLQEASVSNNEDLFATQRITRTIAGAQFKAFVFPNDLPSKATASKYVLIATQSFAALGVITPDYIVPDGFVPISNGLIDFATVDEISYTALPTDGGNALYRDGTRRQNVAKNFAGQTASVGPAVAAPNYQGLWFNPNESGWGVNFAHQGDLIFASWFTYDLSGKGTWLVTTASKTTGATYTGQLFQGTGPAFNAVPFPPLGSPGGAAIGGLGGTATVTFTDASNATFTYTVGGITQTKSITRQLFGPQPVCTFGAQPNLALATNYTDLWWASPPGSEAGWGVNLTHQGDTLFASWFTYDLDHTPMWLVATASKTVANTYAAPQLFKLSGPAFNAVPFPPLGAVGGPTGASVGTATFVFSNGNAASFTYTVNGVTQTKAITREVFNGTGTVCQ